MIETLYKSLRKYQAELDQLSTDLRPGSDKAFAALRRKVRKIKSLIISLEHR